MRHAPSRRGLAIGVAGVGLVLLVAALLTHRVAAPVPKRPPAAVAPVAEPSPLPALLREAEAELLALCAERDRLLETRKELGRTSEAALEAAHLEIAKHLRDGERSYAAGQFEKALREFERADFKVRNVPYEVPSLAELRPLIGSSIAKAKAALAGAAPPPAGVADEHYRLAEGRFQAGDYEGAEAECGKALAIDPRHAAAGALRLEVRFLLGRGQTEEARKASVARRSQTLAEMDDAQARGVALTQAGDLDGAEREFRKILEYAKWMPRDAEFQSRREAAILHLERVQAARR